MYIYIIFIKYIYIYHIYIYIKNNVCETSNKVIYFPCKYISELYSFVSVCVCVCECVFVCVCVYVCERYILYVCIL